MIIINLCIAVLTDFFFFFLYSGFAPIPVEGEKTAKSPPKPPEQSKSNVPKTSPGPQQNNPAASDNPVPQKKPKRE